MSSMKRIFVGPTNIEDPVWYDFTGKDIDLQQVYLLQSEAQKDKTLTFICEYFRHHGLSSTDNIC